MASNFRQQELKNIYIQKYNNGKADLFAMEEKNYVTVPLDYAQLLELRKLVNQTIIEMIIDGKTKQQ